MNILALDLGTTTGWCIGPFGGRPEHGFWQLKTSRFEGGGMRFLRFQKLLTSIHELSPADAVWYEEVRRHRGTDAAHVYGGLQATLTAWCEERHIPYGAIPVGTIKRSATGKGNAGKAEVIEGVRKKGFDVTDDNEADAVALWLCVQEKD